MPSLDLNDAEANALMFVLANAEGKGITWSLVNPLLMTIGHQLQMQKQAYPQQPRPNGDGKEVHDAK